MVLGKNIDTYGPFVSFIILNNDNAVLSKIMMAVFFLTNTISVEHNFDQWF